MESIRIFRPRKRGTLDDSGLSLVEMLIAAAILAIMAASLATVQKMFSRESVSIREKVYASQKALQMMDELRAMVAVGESQGINVLDDYDQGNILADPTGAQSVSIKANSFTPVLTTNKAVTDAANNISLNRTMGGTDWRYMRNIYIRTPAGETDKNVRLVTVRVFYASDVDGIRQPTPLAEVTGVLRSIGETLVPSQAYDIYVLGIYSIPGWWVNVGKLQTTFRDVVGDLSNRNPGFTPRVHYITKMAYGRDQEYAPFVNGPFNDGDADQGWLTNTTGMPYVYFYPGHMQVDGGVDYLFYWSNLFNSDGAQVRIANTATTQLVNDVTQNPGYPEHYSVADQFNHAVRYPDEVRLYQEAWNVAYNLYPNDPTKWPEPSLRMLLERLNSNPALYRNALIINLGGEMLPIPPMRNYSDAAKWPDGFMNGFVNAAQSVTTTLSVAGAPVTVAGTGESFVYPTGQPLALANFRVVTHAEQLQYPAAIATPFPTATTPTWPVTLRVYPYMFPADWFLSGTTLPVVSVYLPFDKIPAGKITIRKIVGRADDILSGLGHVSYSSQPAVLGTDFSVQNLNNGTLIRLCNTPMRHASYTSGGTNYGGLASSDRVDPDLEYIPCPMVSGNIFASGTSGELWNKSISSKNTARWVIALSLATDPGVNPHVVETRLGDTYNWGNQTPSGATTKAITFYDGNENPITKAADYTNAVPSFSANFPTTTYVEGVTTDFQNLSRTYVWVGQQAPRTEQFQIFGPPQFCPYSDVSANGGYNWFWEDADTTRFPNLTQAKTFTYGTVTAANGGWRGADLKNPFEFDYPRVCQLYREGLLRSYAIWSTLNGYSQWASGQGGEIGAESQYPTQYGISMIADKAWGPPSTNGNLSGAQVISEIAGPTDGYQGNDVFHGRRIITQFDSAAKNNSQPVTWRARYWLGELCPDQSYKGWWTKDNATNLSGGGNLPVGIAAGQFFRDDYSNTPRNYSNTLNIGYNTGSLPKSSGPVQFINGTTSANSASANAWYRPANDNGATITSLGSDLANLFNFPMPVDFSTATRPYRLDAADYPPNDWSETEMANERVVCDIPSIGGVPRVFYNPNSNATTAANFDTSGTMRLKKVLVNSAGASTTCVAYIADNGLPAEGPTGTGLLAKIVLITMMRAYFDAGLYTADSHVVQLPRVDMTFPGVGDSIPLNNAVTVIWNSTYLKWDGNPYTAEYSAGYTEAVSLTFGLKYASSLSGPWSWADDGSSTYQGQMPVSPHIILPGASSTVTYSWNAASRGLADGQYYLMVEAYRNGFPLHYSFDVSKFTMKK